MFVTMQVERFVAGSFFPNPLGTALLYGYKTSQWPNVNNSKCFRLSQYEMTSSDLPCVSEFKTITENNDHTL